MDCGEAWPRGQDHRRERKSRLVSRGACCCGGTDERASHQRPSSWSNRRAFHARGRRSRNRARSGRQTWWGTLAAHLDVDGDSAAPCRRLSGWVHRWAMRRVCLKKRR